MARNPTPQESFVLRIWKEPGRSDWRGWVQHTRSGESAVVRSVKELVAFLEERTGRLSESGQRGLK